jgi:phosphomannomutase/phosphoglucomutase
VNVRVFREYDIRGVADRDLSNELALDLGRAIGTMIVRAGGKTFALGRDCRVSSGRLHENLLAGLLETGLAVLDVGEVATPVLYFSVFHLEADGGVQITGSHNPPEDNGFKILRGKTTIHGADIQALRSLIEARDFERRPGGTVAPREIHAAYQAHVIDNVRPHLGPRRFRVVVDAGNGMGGVDAVPILRGLGFDTTPLFCELDGRFPNHHPDPTLEENVADLKKKLVELDAELGIAFDGDADRIGVVDRRGRIVWGDQLMIFYARDILREVPGATFVGEVKCSKAMYDEIARAGGKPIMWKVGHSLIKQKLKESGAVLAGEMSGHIFFAHRYFGFDDAIYSATRLAELLSRSTLTLEEHVDGLPVMYNTPELRVDCPDEIKFEVVKALAARLSGRFEVVAIDGVRVTFADGWGLVRASNTQPVLVTRFEAATPARLTEIRALVESELATAMQSIKA